LDVDLLNPSRLVVMIVENRSKALAGKPLECPIPFPRGSVTSNVPAKPDGACVSDTGKHFLKIDVQAVVNDISWKSRAGPEGNLASSYGRYCYWHVLAKDGYRL